MKIIYRSSLVSMVFWVLIKSQRFMNRTCQSYGSYTVQEFNLKRFSGMWYVYKAYKNNLEDNITCAQMYFNATDAETLLINHKSFDKDKHIINKASHEGVLKMVYPELENGYFQLNKDNRLSIKLLYLFMKTDYSNYAVVWACSNIAWRSIQFLWILSRGDKLKDYMENKVNKKLLQNEIELKNIRVVNNKPKLCKPGKGNNN